jgi:hypothetical protein
VLFELHRDTADLSFGILLFLCGLCLFSGYIKEVQRVLQMVCKTCSRVLLQPIERKHYLMLMNRVEDRKYRAALENVSLMYIRLQHIHSHEIRCHLGVQTYTLISSSLFFDPALFILSSANLNFM